MESETKSPDTSEQPFVHTPGPWGVFHYEEPHSFAGLPSTVGRSWTIGDGECVCNMSILEDTKKAWANAKLIAAAPEMLAAIQGALRIADLWRPSDDTPEEHWEEAKALSMMLRDFEEIERKVV